MRRSNQDNDDEQGSSSTVKTVEVAAQILDGRRRGPWIIKALEERSLISCGKVEGDGRRVMLSIAPKGQILISEVSPESSAIYDDVQRRIGHERYEQLLDLLEGLIDLEKK